MGPSCPPARLDRWSGFGFFLLLPLFFHHVFLPLCFSRFAFLALFTFCLPSLPLWLGCFGPAGRAWRFGWLPGWLVELVGWHSCLAGGDSLAALLA